MSSFFYQTLLSRLSQDKERYPLLKLKELIDFTGVADLLRSHRQNCRGDARGKKSYDPLKMFKAILLGQWHSLSDEALEHALIVWLSVGAIKTALCTKQLKTADLIIQSKRRTKT